MLDVPPVPVTELVRSSTATTASETITRTKASSNEVNQNPFDMEAYLAEHGFEVSKRKPWSSNPGGIIWELDTCPFNSDHKKGSASLMLGPGAAPGFKCKHNGCSGQTIKDLFKIYPPGPSAAVRNDESPGQYSAPKPTGSDSPAFSNLRPQIKVGNRQLPELTKEGLGALQTANTPPVLFVRSGRMVRVVQDEKRRPVSNELNEHALRGQLARAADFYKLSPKGQTWNVSPPMDLVRDVLSRPPTEWKFPGLAGIIEAPALRPNGSIIEADGYDCLTGLYYAPVEDFKVDVPENPAPREHQRVCRFDRGSNRRFSVCRSSQPGKCGGGLVDACMSPSHFGMYSSCSLQRYSPGHGKDFAS